MSTTITFTRNLVDGRLEVEFRPSPRRRCIQGALRQHGPGTMRFPNGTELPGYWNGRYFETDHGSF